MKRWRMNRMGILNFWLYDEEVFELEQGRLLFRGANGSGKSVTMQSFIPLVLDGDKRPERLDSFGSRDRRMEYYLLGDSETGHMDRTGYLWIEFITKINRAIKPSELPCAPEEGRRKWFSGDFCWKMDDGSIKISIYMIIRIGWKQRKRCHSQEKP